jgi:DNA-binding CsgD family transcriptional regulator
LGADLAAFERTKMSGAKISARERECLYWLARGERPDAIAYRLGIKRVTVDFHIRNARRKLDAATRTHAVALALAQRLIEI